MCQVRSTSRLRNLLPSDPTKTNFLGLVLVGRTMTTFSIELINRVGTCLLSLTPGIGIFVSGQIDRMITISDQTVPTK